MKPILFLSDLDHNLFQSKRVDPTGRHPMTVNKDGAAHCFATDAQRELLGLMSKNAFCIAVTARTPSQMMRVTGWQTEQQHDLALTDLGMTLLHRENGGEWSPIPLWSESYIRQANGLSLGLQVDFAQLQEHFCEVFGQGDESPFKFNLNECFEAPGVPFYFVIQIKKGAQSAPDADAVRTQCAIFLEQCQGDYFYHESEGTFAFWPTYVSKASAVQRLLELMEEGGLTDAKGVVDERFEAARLEKGKSTLIMSSGDSISDLGFMKAAHFWMAPSVSQISDSTSFGEMLTPQDYGVK